jgi:translation initiation factor IF-3
LKVQIGNRFIATDDRELMLGLKKLPMHAFIHKEIKINCKISTHDAKLKSTRAAIILERYLEENRIKSSINFEK